jgi:hypothetical protein
MSMPPHRQPSLRVPLDEAENTGVLRAHFHGLHPLTTNLHLWVDVDTGATYSQITSHEAATLGLPIPPGPEIDCSISTAAGRVATRVRPGWMRVWWTNQRTGDPFVWPILFRMMAPTPNPPAIKPVLGLGGVIPECRWTFDGTYTPEHPLGSLLLDDIR